MGKRPYVRGSAMNPIAHPMGGGEGRRSGGRHPVSPTGKLAKGGRTEIHVSQLEMLLFGVEISSLWSVEALVCQPCLIVSFLSYCWNADVSFS